MLFLNSTVREVLSVFEVTIRTDQNYESGSSCYGYGSTTLKEKLAITFNFPGKSML
jgi:hypothetical protein